MLANKITWGNEELKDDNFLLFSGNTQTTPKSLSLYIYNLFFFGKTVSLLEYMAIFSFLYIDKPSRSNGHHCSLTLNSWSRVHLFVKITSIYMVRYFSPEVPPLHYPCTTIYMDQWDGGNGLSLCSFWLQIEEPMCLSVLLNVYNVKKCKSVWTLLPIFQF